MAIRLPLQGIKTYSEVNGNTPGASSVAGGTPIPFVIPMDTDNVVVKLQASVSGGGYSALFQTSDDGGSTWFDVARTSIVSNTAGNYAAEWLSIPVISPGINPGNRTLQVAGSILGAAIGKAPASTLGALQVSGLPIMGTLNRVFLISTGTITATSLVQVDVKVNSQSATA